jgi:tetratricopeptide (TPR) repeat protein
MERYQEAADLYGQILDEDPGNVTVMSNLAGALSQLGMADSVQTLYDQLLNRPGLTERDFFNAGVGLYQIENWDKAAEAFSRAAELNPFNRDARMNLAQTYMIAENYEAAVPAARALLELDPRNQEGWLWLTRSLGETGAEEEASTTINQYQEMGYHVTNIQLQGMADGGANISGEIVNDSAEPGQTITLRFHFGGPDGEEVGTQDVRVQMPAAGQSASFNAQYSSSELVSGYRYEVVGG